MGRPIEVIAYAGYCGAQEPRAVVIDSERQLVREVKRRWRSPDGCYFEVELASGGRLILRHTESEEPSWSVVPAPALPSGNGV